MLKIITLVLFILWRLYWSLTEKQADQEKPKIKEKPSFFNRKRISRNLLWLLAPLLVLQLLGMPILPMPVSFPFQVLGFCMVVSGLGLAIIARRQLGTNWANAYEYQVKKKQELVTTGVYKYVRHPIYTGLIPAVIGAEIVAESYLFLVFILFILGAYKQAKLEEELLMTHFGDAYKKYMKRSKMFIPYLW